MSNNKNNKKIAGLLILVLLLLASPALADTADLLSEIFSKTKKDQLFSRQIVVLKNEINNETANTLLDQIGAFKIKQLAGNSHVAWLPKSAVTQLQAQDEVLRVEPDILVYILDNERGRDYSHRRFRRTYTPPAESSDTVPWGVSKIGAVDSWNLTKGAGLEVAVIDTGVDLDHPDLLNNLRPGYNVIDPGRKPEDDNGHGTHVAGIIAADDNKRGIVGVAPDAALYPVKALDRRGAGYLSDIIEGIDWAIGQDVDAINLSIGTTVDVQSFHDAVKRAFDAGIVVVAAAGNDGGAVNYPAAYPEAIAIAATDSNNNIPYWSSWGPELDMAAPGVSIYSTYKGGGYTTMSGTSMATPHTAGAALLLKSRPEFCDTNFDLICDPAEIKNRLEQTALDLGPTGFDPDSGWGLVQIARALGL